MEGSLWNVTFFPSVQLSSIISRVRNSCEFCGLQLPAGVVREKNIMSWGNKGNECYPFWNSFPFHLLFKNYFLIKKNFFDCAVRQWWNDWSGDTKDGGVRTVHYGQSLVRPTESQSWIGPITIDCKIQDGWSMSRASAIENNNNFFWAMKIVKISWQARFLSK